MSDPTLSDIDFENKMALVWTTLKKIKKKLKFLGVVQTQAILFSKSISERVGSDIERL